MKATIFREWEYRDPAEVLERREEEAEARELARTARVEADQVIEAARVLEQTPLSPITKRLMKRMRIQALVKEVMRKRGG